MSTVILFFMMVFFTPYFLQQVAGLIGPEFVVRYAQAIPYAAGPHTGFVDFCNERLIPGFEMSGGHARFSSGGRLPAHYHDFDESICIIHGTASCVVEGRRYLLGGCDTAFVPRGRIHYFVNDTQDRMEMIWFYAGQLPERIVVDEQCATIDGDPWRSPG